MLLTASMARSVTAQHLLGVQAGLVHVPPLATYLRPPFPWRRKFQRGLISSASYQRVRPNFFVLESSQIQSMPELVPMHVPMKFLAHCMAAYNERRLAMQLRRSAPTGAAVQQQ